MKIEYGRAEANRPHLFADAIEVMCAFDTGGPVSETDAFSLLESSPRSAEEIVNADEDDLDDNGLDDDLNSSQITESMQIKVDNAFEQLSFRSAAFGEFYPFEFSDGALSLRPAPLPALQQAYLLLLASSRIRTFKPDEGRDDERGIKQHLADAFELLCKEALRSMLPSDAEVVHFGASSVEKINRFGSDLRLALPALAEFMGVDLSSRWDPEEFAAQGDGGIDLVGVQKLDELQYGWNVIIGQCAAIEHENDWQKKRQEAKIGEVHGSTFDFYLSPQPVLFVPSCFRKSEGTWIKSRFANGVILMDRLRILRRLADSPDKVSVSADMLVDKLGELIATDFEPIPA
ncbi:MAG: hypothetical protein AAF768_10975 [Pseudomonadota bacterium]